MVVDRNSRKALLPWEIVQSHSETDTIRQFINSVLAPMLSGPLTATEPGSNAGSFNIIIINCHVEVYVTGFWKMVPNHTFLFQYIYHCHMKKIAFSIIFHSNT